MPAKTKVETPAKVPPAQSTPQPEQETPARATTRLRRSIVRPPVNGGPLAGLWPPPSGTGGAPNRARMTAAMQRMVGNRRTGLMLAQAVQSPPMVQDGRVQGYFSQAPTVQMKCPACEEEEAQRAQPVQTKCAACEKEEGQKSAAGGEPQGAVLAMAAKGVSGASQPLPHLDRVQASFGRHDVTNARAEVGGPAEMANASMGALAYTMGDRIGFRHEPDVQLAAHEATHIVQQRNGAKLPGGIGQPEDAYEQQADEVAGAVLRGESAEPILDRTVGGTTTGTGSPRDSRDTAEQQYGPEGPTRPLRFQSTDGNRRSSELFAGRPNTGRPLPLMVQRHFGARLGVDLSRVRIHTEPEAAARADRISAAAFTEGEHIYFGRGEYNPDSHDGRSLLAHELVHTVQSAAGATAGAGTSLAALENEASILGQETMKANGSVRSVSGRALPGSGPLRQGRGGRRRESDPENPIEGWLRGQNSILLLQDDQDHLFLIPGTNLVFFPTRQTQQQFQQSVPHLTTDVGTLFEVAATGASGTRVFKVGSRSALLIDAGFDPSPANQLRPQTPTNQPPTGRAAVFLNELSGVTANLGITRVSRMQVIHGHLDHVGGVPLAVQRFGTRAQNVIIPEQFRSLGPVRQAIRALQNTTDPDLVSRGFGSAWNPQVRMRDRGAPGSDIFRHTFQIGDLHVELIGLRSALRNARAKPDRASHLTKVTRLTDRASVVILGDLRGADLEQFQRAMETERTGSWREFFRGVRTLSGFSHHAGALEAGDVRGIMSLLEATLLSEGQLRIIEQTALRGRTRQTRLDTLELLNRLGATTAYTDLPAGGATSGASASRTTVSARGPAATVNQPVQSNITSGLERVLRLQAAAETIDLWRPWLVEVTQNEIELNRIQSELRASAQSLRGSVRQAVEAGVNVRAAPRTLGSTAARDYTATGGSPGQAFQTALNGIPSTTTAETALAREIEVLQRLRAQNVEEIPLRVAMHQAIVRGVYSDQAFAKMLGELEPATRDRLLRGRRGGLVPRLKAFQRVRAVYNFRHSVSSGEWSVSGFRTSGGRAGGRVTGGILLALEIWNNLVRPLWEAHETSRRINNATQVVPFLRRFMFWSQMMVQPKLVGVDDPSFGSPSFIRSMDDINRSLSDLDAVFIEAPGLEDIDVARLGFWLAYHVRNYDEYATLFVDSGQDAVRHVSPASGPTYWNLQEWQVRVGRYETSGSNRVIESWHTHPRLTQLMRKFTDYIAGNTRLLLEQYGRGEVSDETRAVLGEISEAEQHIRYRARLRQQGTPRTTVQVPVLGNFKHGPSWLDREVEWWSPPQFFVMDESATDAKVVGADHNTFAIIRDLPTEERQYEAGPRYWGDVVRQTNNSEGWVWIPKNLIERIPDATSQKPATPVQSTVTRQNQSGR